MYYIVLHCTVLRYIVFLCGHSEMVHFVLHGLVRYFIVTVLQCKDQPIRMEVVPEDRKCPYNYLGNSGLRVSNISLGALTFGEHNVSDLW